MKEGSEGVKEGSEGVEGGVIGLVEYRVVLAWKGTAAVKLNAVSHWSTAQSSVIADNRWTPVTTPPLSLLS